MAEIPRHVAQFGRRFFPPGLWEGPADRPWVALTFDDGPHPELTPRILDALGAEEAPGTFFLEGCRAVKQPDLVRRIRQEGHEVGNHTWAHWPLIAGCGSPDRAIARTEELLAQLAPGSLRVIRPPFGWVGPGGAGAIARQGLVPVYWSVVPADWDPLPPEELQRRVLAAVHPGAVIVLHGGRSAQTGAAGAVQGLVTELRLRGFEIVPLGQMLAGAGLEAGRR
jgi:peptidoglycan/xylan/chitin deacetylase (PgdA/CDA1 family)